LTKDDLPECIVAEPLLLRVEGGRVDAAIPVHSAVYRSSRRFTWDEVFFSIEIEKLIAVHWIAT
jgi:hypothetical protein